MGLFHRSTFDQRKLSLSKPATQVVPQLAERKFANRQELEAC